MDVNTRCYHKAKAQEMPTNDIIFVIAVLFVLF